LPTHLTEPCLLTWSRNREMSGRVEFPKDCWCLLAHRKVHKPWTRDRSQRELHGYHNNLYTLCYRSLETLPTNHPNEWNYHQRQHSFWLGKVAQTMLLRRHRQEDHKFKDSSNKKLARPYLKKQKGQGHGSSGKSLPSKYEALGSIPSTAK
jgi:hypothetical protein